LTWGVIAKFLSTVLRDIGWLNVTLMAAPTGTRSPTGSADSI
jgi:hypothetical protein